MVAYSFTQGYKKHPRLNEPRLLDVCGKNLLKREGECFAWQDLGTCAGNEEGNDENACPKLDVGTVESSTHDGDRLKGAWS